MRSTVFQVALLASLAWTEHCGHGFFAGEGTYYEYAGGGNCCYPIPAPPGYTAAMNRPQYVSR